MIDNPTDKLTPIERILQERETAASQFDRTHAAIIPDVIADIQKAHNILAFWLLYGSEPLCARFDAFALLNSASNILISGFQLFRQRAPVEGLILLRASLETSAAALHVFHDSQVREEYLKGKSGNFESTRSISFAKRFCPRIGELWGGLSRIAVHVNSHAHGPELELKEGEQSRVVHLGARQARPDLEPKLLLLTRLVATINLQAEEMIFLEKHAANSFVIAGSSMGYYYDTETAIEKLFETFTANEQ